MGLPLFPLLLLLLGSLASSSQGRRLICWQAMLQCQEEPDCSYAFSQYAEACAPVLMAATGGGMGEAAPSNNNNNNNHRRRCPSHCISALIQLNHTRRGPALEDCDCDQDENCRATKRAIEPCLPRMGGHGNGNGGGSDSGGAIGCTEARRRCDWDGRCSLALGRYMAHCGKLFNGLRCTEECRAVIQDMLAVPKALLLNDCVCDGLERPICESVKENMARLCFGGGHGSSGASSDGGAGAFDDDYYDEYEDDPAVPPPPPRSEDGEGALLPQPGRHDDSATSGGRGLPSGLSWTLLALLPCLLLSS
ncbi:growth arrest-specific protein 1 [Anolis carolinensis]|nr:PREDICTED: growth arrest-specific protein 1 [Anolis carolinensis]|eukprot:XP_008101432.1 PREDICTED: growth arrest-specific protein 1 [Anolis carolinensis]